MKGRYRNFQGFISHTLLRRKTSRSNILMPHAFGGNPSQTGSLRLRYGLDALPKISAFFS